MRGECGKQDYLWMIDKHLCQRMTDKHDHLHMTAKHDHSGQTLTHSNLVTFSAYIIIISIRPLSLVKYRAPQKQTMTGCLLQQWGGMTNQTRPAHWTNSLLIHPFPFLPALINYQCKWESIANIPARIRKLMTRNIMFWLTRSFLLSSSCGKRQRSAEKRRRTCDELESWWRL